MCSHLVTYKKVIGDFKLKPRPRHSPQIPFDHKKMENGYSNKRGGMSVEIPQCRAGLAQQTSMTKGTCLCSPTTHAGSFRCRLHRSTGASLQRTKSVDVAASMSDSSAQG
ncbi:hypothetical protein AKJ16_DCAP18115 [Drosera capensis]